MEGTPERIGDYRIVREIGRGAMGVVLEAIQERLNRRVALKVLPATLFRSAQAIERFQEEAKAAAQLRHPNIVPVHDAGREGDIYYYSMDLVEGTPLDRVVARTAGRGPEVLNDSYFEMAVEGVRGAQGEELKKAPEADRKPAQPPRVPRESCLGLASLFAEVADALAYAHGKGIVHRDIKPSNLILDSQGRVVITDFSLARIGDRRAITGSDRLLGTPLYVSPEQIRGKRRGSGPATDIYSLGVTLYECVTLTPPFLAEECEQVLYKILNDEPAPPRSSNPEVPKDLETIILKAMARDPDDRYPSADAFAEDLRRFTRGEPILARPLGPLGRAWRKVVRHRAFAVSVAAVILIALGLWVRAVHLSHKRAEEFRTAVARGTRLAEEGQTRDAERELRRAVDLMPDRPDDHVVLGDLYLLLDHADRAVFEFERALAHRPENVSIRLRLAEAYLARDPRYFPNSRQQAMDQAEWVLKRNPVHLDALLIKAQCLDDENRLDEAEEVLRHAMTLHPDSALVYHELGKVLEHRDDPEAKAFYQKAAGMDPNLAKARFALGECFEDEGDYERAVPEMEAAVRLRRDKTKYHAGLARVYLKVGLLEDARKEATEAIDRGAPRADYYLIRGEVLLRLGEPALALEDLREADRLDPNEVPTLQLLTRALLATGQDKDARDIPQRLGSLSHKREDLIQSASLHALVGNQKEAEDWFSKVPRPLSPAELKALKTDPFHEKLREVAAVKELLGAGKP